MINNGGKKKERNPRDLVRMIVKGLSRRRRRRSSKFQSLNLVVSVLENRRSKRNRSNRITRRIRTILY